MSSAPSSHLLPTCAFYGPNFLKDVQTTKLNAQLDVKGPSPVEYMWTGVRPIFLPRVVSPARERLPWDVALNVE